MRTTMLIVSCALAASMAAGADAAERHVPSQYQSIQAAIDAAAPGDVVIVADGVYSGAGNRNIDFGGKAITVRSANGPEATTLQIHASPEHPARGVQFVSGEGADSVLEGFTITGGATPPGAIDNLFNGGGILVSNGSSPTILNCILRGNQCGCWGGAICISGGSPMIIGCELVGNRADDNGGGLFIWEQSTPVIVNTIISGNDGGGSGGGIATFGGGPTTIVNSTIVGNTAASGEAVHAFNTTIINSIVWGSESNLMIGSPVISHSNVQGGYAGTGNMNVDPLFVDAANGDYHLSPESPLIGAGNTAMLPQGVEQDADGDPRVIGFRIDIGADEVLLTGDVNFDGLIDVSDLVQVIVAWGSCNDCAADINGDGAVDVDDLVLVITNWSS